MATMITSECINCGACEPECPNTAIYQGGVEWEMNGVKHPPLSADVFYIVPEKCTECVGFHDQEACAAVCPVDVCIPNPDIPESEEVLLQRARELHPASSSAPISPRASALAARPAAPTGAAAASPAAGLDRGRHAGSGCCARPVAAVAAEPSRASACRRSTSGKCRSTVMPAMVRTPLRSATCAPATCCAARSAPRPTSSPRPCTATSAARSKPSTGAGPRSSRRCASSDGASWPSSRSASAPSSRRSTSS